MECFDGKNVLITGGTGSFGRTATQESLKQNIASLTIFSRDEEKQFSMKREFTDDRIGFIIGDVRDYEAVSEAMKGVDIVYHAAALKIISTCEQYPIESLKTNVIGTWNVKRAAARNGVDRAIFIGTDKSVQPVNVYGACKMFAEKLWIQKQGNTRFSSVRYGNILGSRGSIVPYFKELVKQGKPLPITHLDMTRFTLTLKQAFALVMRATEEAKGGEIYIPKIPACKVTDLGLALYGENYLSKVVGVRQGEKIHETLINQEESRRTEDKGDYYVVHPYGKFENAEPKEYSSDKTKKLTIEELREMLKSEGWIEY